MKPDGVFSGSLCIVKKRVGLIQELGHITLLACPHPCEYPLSGRFACGPIARNNHDEFIPARACHKIGFSYG